MEDQYKAEQERIDWRRETLGIDTPAEPRRRPWALALSGGGIRSATFCFGVLQALARAPYTPANRPLGSTGDAPAERLLPRFDYLSTVSGGGYMGSFFSSLFQPGRLRPSTGTEQAQARQAAEDAYRVLSYQPPGRIHSSTNYRAAPVGAGPTAWLRENGRYLTPTGAGDLLYALAMTWRNWVAVHLVIGLPILLVTALLALTQGVACSRWNLFCDHLLAIPLGIALLAVAPLMLAYWLIYSRKTQDEPPALLNWATGSALAMAAALGWLTCQVPDTADWLPVPARDLLWIVVTVLGLGLAWCAALVASQRLKQHPDDGGLDADNVRNYRVNVTRALSTAITWAAVALVLVLVHQLTFELYTVLARHWQGSLTFSVLPVLIWLVRHLARSRDEKPAPGLLKKLPLDALALVAGLVLLLAVTLAWGLLAHWFAWNGRVPGAHAGDAQLFRFGLLAAIALVMTVVTGQFIGFINLSSLQAFYAARLTRAYLGASNGQRFDVSCAQSRRRMSVAQTLSRDDIPLKDYYGKRTAGPLHLINVTMNLTVDPAEQLVQRDRKGKPLCVAPYRYTPGGEQDQVTSFILDGQRKSRQPPNGRGEINQPLSLGQWVATSGAAASTGLGRQTSLGLSLLLGLANVRLGTWWQSNFVGRAKPLSRIGEASSHWLPTQTYLFYELTARFHGHRRDKLYLTDGGHFENTATYELLRPARDIELVVMCDCGCDPEYRFDDLANLVRLSRIDHDLEIEEDPGVLRHPLLSQVFGSTQSLRAATEPSDRRCAVLLNVFHTPDRENPDIPRRLTSRILLIKPRLIEGVPTDVLNYVRANPDFPNQTTGDQFFDEAQFESYRQLGLSIGQLLFGDGQRPNNIAHALSRYLAKPVLEDAAGE
ncbi:patatin-like phospholipase domain-containing protein [Metapseudomonas otitidis]|uniref:Uncharacterized protein n=1 Tax=Metapseudomonas otitidis TaxID=319939 RepID=A0A679GG13_9GAMM|nr:patatin-like phospholipase family protein [Pseudomonas otitidis]BCA28042.1 hypothetical protein PtoMrB4_20190 [Pseudomonas otitidis]